MVDTPTHAACPAFALGSGCSEPRLPRLHGGVQLAAWVWHAATTALADAVQMCWTKSRSIPGAGFVSSGINKS
jgi:hypothetical protein